MRLLLGTAMFPSKLVNHIAAAIGIKRDAAGYSLSKLAEKGLAVRASSKVDAPIELTPAGRSCLSAYPRLAMETVGSRLGHMAVLEKEELLVSTGSDADDRIAAFRSWLENPSETLSNAVEEDENTATYGAGDVAEESVALLRVILTSLRRRA